LSSGKFEKANWRSSLWRPESEKPYTWKNPMLKVRARGTRRKGNGKEKSKAAESQEHATLRYKSKIVELWGGRGGMDIQKRGRYVE